MAEDVKSGKTLRDTFIAMLASIPGGANKGLTESAAKAVVSVYPTVRECKPRSGGLVSALDSDLCACTCVLVYEGWERLDTIAERESMLRGIPVRHWSCVSEQSHSSDPAGRYQIGNKVNGAQTHHTINAAMSANVYNVMTSCK